MYIDIVGTDVNMILHVGFLEVGSGVITRRGYFLDSQLVVNNISEDWH